jgi:hypothetical protein
MAERYDADRYDAEPSAPRRAPAAAPRRAALTALREAASLDLATMRLVLRQHLDDLRLRGVEEEVLRPIELELRRYDETVGHLIRQQQR